jgi:hypothetical protein
VRPRGWFRISNAEGVVHTILNKRPSRGKVNNTKFGVAGTGRLRVVGHETGACLEGGDYDVWSIGSRPIQLSANERGEWFARPKL